MAILSRRPLRWLPAALVPALVAGLLTVPAHAATVATPVATGLAVPAAFTFLPDGRAVYGERFTGRVRLRDLATGADSLVWTITDVATEGERGLLGIAVDPDYPIKPNIYVYVTRNVGGFAENQIVRIRTTQRQVGTSETILYRATSTLNHNGGRIMFGPGRHLYAVTGDVQNPANSQNLDVPYGKMLRMDPNGAVPPDNPVPGSLVWAFGIRNSYGFTFDPATSLLWQTENGPACNDELNRISKGRNYGWGPSQTCSTPPFAPANTNQDGPRPVQPLAWYTPTTAPTGAAFCSGCGLGADLEGRMVYGTFNTRQLRAVTLTAARTGIVGEAPIYTHTAGVLSVERAPDGRLYFSDASGIYRLASA